ncbi:MAG: hypothetical protein WBJ85_04135 [Acetomicrobium sp.]
MPSGIDAGVRSCTKVTLSRCFSCGQRLTLEVNASKNKDFAYISLYMLMIAVH